MKLKNKIRIRAGSFEHDGWLLGSPGPNPWDGKLFRPKEAEKTFTLQPSDNDASKVVVVSEIGHQWEVDVDRVDAILAESDPVKTVNGWAFS